jgi:uroporphyrinogen III methyltransferase/synthase
VPGRYIAEGLLDAFAPYVLKGQRILLPRAAGARDTLIDGLTSRGATVDELQLYTAAIPESPDADGLRRLRAGEIDVATFASSSAVRNLITMLEGDTAPLRDVAIAAIGPVTAAAVRDAGLPVAIEAREYTIEGLVDAIVEHLG